MTNAAAAEAQFGGRFAPRLPLVVGVTGHRDIATADEPALRAAFREELDRLATTSPHTPLLVVSALASGADTLAAEEALDRGIAVLAALPLPPSQYERDFDDAGRARFRAALERCAAVRILSTTTPEAGYMATAYFIARYSHILVAFWDGLPGLGDGGTADVVRLRTTGSADRIEAAIDVPSLPDIGPVYQIQTRRKDHGGEIRSGEVRHLHPRRFHGDARAEADFDAALKRLDLYNADMLAATAGSATEASPRAIMERADARANRLQRTTLLFLDLLYVFAFLAAAAQIVAGSEAAKIIALAVAFTFFLFARRNDYENRYQDYRAIAEALRVRAAWYGAGVHSKSVEACYLRMHQSELQWIRMALRTIDLLYPVVALDEPALAHPDCRAWLRGQWRFYYEASRREAGRDRVLALIAKGAAGVGIVLSAIATALLFPQVQHIIGWAPVVPMGGTAPAFWQSALFWKHMTTVPVTLGAALAVLLSHYAEKRGFSTNAKRYERMFLVFDAARRRLKRMPDGTAACREVVRDLGQEALVEHADWLLQRRERPLSFVQG